MTIRKIVIRKNGEPYLTRYFISPPSQEGYLTTRRRPKILLHHIHMPDGDRDPHDHPWNFLSIVLRGGYLERRWELRNTSWVVRRRRWHWAFRRSTDLHEVLTVKPDTWTLMIVGKKVGTWGFQTEQGWVRWFKYLEERPDWTEVTP